MATKKVDSNSSDSLYLNRLKFQESDRRLLINILFKNVRLLMLLLLSLVGIGVFAFLNLPRELNPEVDIPIVSVVTTLPGATPLEIEQLVTTPLEKEIQSIPSLSQLTSSSQGSVSIITAEFSSRTDTDEAVDLVSEQVDKVTDLPDQAESPQVSKLDFNDQPVLQIALTSSIDRSSLSRIATEVADAVETSSKIRKVETTGADEPQITVALLPTAIQEYQLDLSQLSQAISAADVSIPAGTITLNQTEYQLSVDNQFISIEDVRSLPITIQGQTVELGQVADVYYDIEDGGSLALYQQPNGAIQNAVTLSIYKTEASTITDAVAAADQIIEQELTAYESVIPVTILDFSHDIEEQFGDLAGNFRDTVLLVFFTLFLFLGLRQAATAAVSIPLTFLSSFALMYMIGISLNFLSLFSLLLALGLVVDDAIVIVQAMHSYSKKFSDPIKAGLLVFKDFVVPIWTTTITTVWAFVPLLLATGIIGEFIKSIPVVVTTTLLSSTTIAVLINLPLTVLLAKLSLPKRVKALMYGTLVVLSIGIVYLATANSYLSIAAVLLWVLVLGVAAWNRTEILTGLSTFKKRLQQRSKINFKRLNLLETGLLNFSAVSTRYHDLLLRILKHKKQRVRVYVISALFFVVSVAFLMTGLLRNEFFPKTDEDIIYVGLSAPAGTQLETTLEYVQEANQALLTTGNDAIASSVITTHSTFDPNSFGGGQRGPHLATITIRLVDPNKRTATSSQLAEQFRNVLGDTLAIDYNVIEISGGPPAGADLQVNVKGADLAELELLSNEFVRILDQMPEAINADSSLESSSGKVKVVLNHQQLQQRGLVAAQVGGWLRTAITGSEPTTISLGGEDVPVLLTIADSGQQLGQLQSMRLPSQFGRYTLAEVADFTLENNPITIAHQDGQRVITVSAGAAPGVSAPELLAVFQEQAAEVELEPGYTWDVGGVNEENQASVASIIRAMGLSAALILITMVLQLNSFRKSALVLLVIPLAVAGVFFNFTLLGIPLSFPALIGVLALFGIVVNNSIMLVEKINQNLKIGLPFYEAIADACASRIEAIFFTSITTAIGLLPITISDPLWRGLGGAIIAGLSVSGLLILVLLPAAFVDMYKGKYQVKSRSA